MPKAESGKGDSDASPETMTETLSPYQRPKPWPVANATHCYPTLSRRAGRETRDYCEGRGAAALRIALAAANLGT